MALASSDTPSTLRTDAAKAQILDELTRRVKEIRDKHHDGAANLETNLALKKAQGLELVRLAISSGSNSISDEEVDLAAKTLREIIEWQRKKLRDAGEISEEERELRLNSISTLNLVAKKLEERSSRAAKINRPQDAAFENRASREMAKNPQKVVAGREF